MNRKRVYMKLDDQVTVSSTGQLSTLRKVATRQKFALPPIGPPGAAASRALGCMQCRC